MDSPIERIKIFEQVAAHLESQILAGALKPGDRLPPERELRETLGVGRPAIREALIRLQQKGLVEVANGVRARVARPTAQRIVQGMVPAVQQFLANSDGQAQLQGVRLFLEVGLVRHAARHATAEEILTLERLIEDNRSEIGNAEGFIKTDVAFHSMFAKISGNQIFKAIYDAMSTWLYEQRRRALIRPADYEINFKAHKRIFDAVASRDPEGAEAAMQDHLAWGQRWSGGE